MLKLDTNYLGMPEPSTLEPAPVPAQTLAVQPKAKAKVRAKRKQELNGNITVGVASVFMDNPSTQFGKLNGITDDRTYAIVAANIHSSTGKRYLNLIIDDLSLDNRAINLTTGMMGNYKFHLGYSGLDNLLSNNSQTPFVGSGGPELTLPAGFIKGDTTTSMTNLAASMNNVGLGTKRKEGDASFSFQVGKNIGLSLSLRRYLKNGTKSMGAVVLPDASGPQGLVLPEPVNYHTDELRTGLDWHGERGQVNLEYYYSRFTNNNGSLTWDNPYTRAGFPVYPDAGSTSLPPDNQHQRISLSGSFKLAATTRLTALYERGAMTQDETFLPYTVNPASTISAPLPRSSPNARIDTSLYKLDLTTQPLPALSLHAGYRRYGTDNMTPRDLYQMVINDSGNQVSLNSIAAQYSRPLDYKQSQIALDSSYYFGKGTTLKLGYDREQKDYRYRAVNATRENTFTAKLNKRWDAGATAFLNVARGRKRSDGYDEKRDIESIHTSDYLDTLPANEYFDNLPAMRQFDIADRDRWREGLGVTLLPRTDLAIGLNANLNRDEYNASQFGLQEQEAKNLTLNATLTPDEFSSWSLYYTRQDISWRQAGRAYLWGSKAVTSSDPRNDWSARHQDMIDTIGINITLTFLDDKLPVQLGYAYSNVNTDISFTADPASQVNTPPDNMPTLTGRRQITELSGTYIVRDNLSVKAGAMLEIYRSSDWATDGLPPGSSNAPTVLTLSGSSAPYRTIVINTALNYRF